MDDTDNNRWLKEMLTDVRAETAEVRRTLARIDSTLTVQHVTLEEHTRRSEANEAAVALLKAEIKPLSLHVAVVGALGKVLGILGTVAGIGVAVMKLLGH